MDMNVVNTEVKFNACPTTPEGALEASETAAGVTSPILNGNGLNITSASDLQKLVDLMKMAQNEERERQVSQKFSIILARLTAENGQIDAAQKAAVDAVGKATNDLNARTVDLGEAAKSYEEAKNTLATDIGALNARLAELESKKSELAGKQAELNSLDTEIAGLKAERDAKEIECATAKTALDELKVNRAATKELMDLAIAELEKLNEAMKTTPEERAKAEERKERIAEEAAAEEATEAEDKQAEIAALEKKIAGYEAALISMDADIAAQEGAVKSLTAAVAALNTAIAGKEQERQTVNTAIGTLTSEISTLTGQVAALTTTVASDRAVLTACEQQLKTATADYAAAHMVLAEALTALNGIGVSVLADAIKLTAVDASKETEEAQNKNDEKVEALKKLAEALSKAIEEKNDEDLEKLVAKLPDTLADLFGAPGVLSPADLPGYELRA